MTQPVEAVGGDGNPADANPASPFEDIAAEMLGEEQEEEQPAEAAEEEAEQAEPDADEEAEEELDDEPDLPAIDPPNSLTAEEKEAFKNLPREAQEFTARRIGDLEKGFQAKAQEAAQSKQAAQLEAYKLVEQIKAEAVQRLQHFAKQFEVNAPEAALMDPQSQHYNPVAYAQQLQAYQHYTAQRQQAQREADQAMGEQAQIQEARAAHEAEMFHQRLAAELPEALDPTSGQKLLQELAATAQSLGFDPNTIDNVTQIKALKVVNDLKSKADKYDVLMSKKMERVRAGKAPPPIAKPGTARAPDQTRKARADAAWQAATSAKSRGAKDEALATWMENTGWL